MTRSILWEIVGQNGSKYRPQFPVIKWKLIAQHIAPIFSCINWSMSAHPMHTMKNLSCGNVPAAKLSLGTPISIKVAAQVVRQEFQTVSFEQILAWNARKRSMPLRIYIPSQQRLRSGFKQRNLFKNFVTVFPISLQQVKTYFVSSTLRGKWRQRRILFWETWKPRRNCNVTASFWLQIGRSTHS